MNMVTPAMQLASKIPDVHVQLWASAILKGKKYYVPIMISNLKVESRFQTLSGGDTYICTDVCCGFDHLVSRQYSAEGA
jgi:hypothetical protein